jgi:hypothetical protein
MKSKIQFVIFGLLTVLSILSLLTGARAQTTLDCSTIPGASNYGTDLSVCHMPNPSTLECSQDKGGLSFCQVQHANGFVSRGVRGGPNSPIEGLGMLVGWMIHTRQQHVTDKAIDNASSTVLLTIKHSMHLMDMSALVERLVPYLPPEQRDQWVKLSKGLADQSSAFSSAVSYFSSNWTGADSSRFHSAARQLDQLYTSGLVAVCEARSSPSMIFTGRLARTDSSFPVRI